MLNEISRILHFGENNSLNNNDLFHHVFIHVFRDNSKYISWKYGALFSVCFKVYSLTWRQKAAMGYWSPWEFQHSTWVFEDIWSICGRKLEPVQLKVHRELLILFHIFFSSAAKEWHMSVVRPCCLLGKKCLSSSDRCWHYRPCVLPGRWNLARAQTTDLQELAQDKRRQTAARWIGGKAVLNLVGALMTLVILRSSSLQLHKKLIPPERPFARSIKKEGELTGLICGPSVNDDTPSTPCRSMIHQLVSTLSIHLQVYRVPWAHRAACKYNPATEWAFSSALQ